jgi:hypothetical protein
MAKTLNSSWTSNAVARAVFRHTYPEKQRKRPRAHRERRTGRRSSAQEACIDRAEIEVWAGAALRNQAPDMTARRIVAP